MIDVKNHISNWDPVHDGREVFLAYLRAQCSPGQPMACLSASPERTGDGMGAAAAVLLSLLDPGLSLALVGSNASSLAWLYQQTGAHEAPVAEADFVLCTADPTLSIEQARRGTPEHPEWGATVIVAAGVRLGEAPLVLTGPGINGERHTELALPPASINAFTQANTDFPRGVDLLITHQSTVTALPRSCRILQKGH